MSKYHSRKTVVNGIKFDSRREADAYCKLFLLERAGKISNLRLQVPYELQEKFTLKGKTIRAIKYVADFVYTDENGVEHIIDVKGVRTEVYKLKKKMFMYRYKKTIEEW